MAIFDPNKPLDPRILEAMIQQSGAPEELAQIENQRKLAELIGKNALEYNPNLGKGVGSKAALGGFAGAVGQGLQGYMMGDQQRQATEALRLLKQQGMGNRRTYIEGLYGGPKDRRSLPPDDDEMMNSYILNSNAGLPY